MNSSGKNELQQNPPQASKQAPLMVWDRENRTLIEERIYGDRFIRMVYEKPAGRLFWPLLAGSPWFSQFYGYLQDHPSSKRKIQSFISKFGIRMEEYEAKEYACFNDFFIRRFRKGSRPFVEEPRTFAAPCEARYLVHNECGEEMTLPVKGALVSPAKLLGNSELASQFIGGPVAIARLCPTDYHRFHFPDSGHILKSYKIPGPLHSVNPLALRAYKEVLIKNERHVTVLKTQHFGKVAMVDVGATCVGKIVQHKHVDQSFKRGEEKGYFLFGGSTTILLGTPGAWKWDEDLVEKSAQGIEAFVKLGTRIGQHMA